MPRGRKAKVKGSARKQSFRRSRKPLVFEPIGTAGSDYGCCSGGKHSKIISMGLVLILLGFAVKLGWGIADLLLLAGAIFLVKGLIIGMMKK